MSTSGLLRSSNIPSGETSAQLSTASLHDHKLHTRRGSMPLMMPSDSSRLGKTPITPAIRSPAFVSSEGFSASNFSLKESDINATLLTSIKKCQDRMISLDSLISSHRLKSAKLDERIVTLRSLYEQRRAESQEMDVILEHVKDRQREFRKGLEFLAEDSQKTRYAVGIIQEKVSEIEETIDMTIKRIDELKAKV